MPLSSSGTVAVRCSTGEVEIDWTLSFEQLGAERQKRLKEESSDAIG